MNRTRCPRNQQARGSSNFFDSYLRNLRRLRHRLGIFVLAVRIGSGLRRCAAGRRKVKLVGFFHPSLQHSKAYGGENGETRSVAGNFDLLRRFADKFDLDRLIQIHPLRRLLGKLVENPRRTRSVLLEPPSRMDATPSTCWSCYNDTDINSFYFYEVGQLKKF
ncbi:unnamed protein product [Nesidiocoris tenuis]|uniref:Uncharacterized protein n=1 Tax=Nesidiocoris tenuis TaxID=355587 RepID=A0A6H5GL40_9HEMI|nr:unnamed protein product [Nesidiocoris tenuis]